MNFGKAYRAYRESCRQNALKYLRERLVVVKTEIGIKHREYRDILERIRALEES